MNEDVDSLIDLVKEVVYGNRRDNTMARQLESAILRQLPDADDDERFDELMHVLASYNPERGEYIYNESAPFPGVT